MIDLNELIEKIKNVNILKLSKASGVSRGMLYKIINGESSPTYKTVEKILVGVKKING